MASRSKELIKYDPKQTTVIYPDGSTKTFKSRWAAAKSVGVNANRVSVWVGRDTKVPAGPFKGFWFRDTKKMLYDRLTNGAGTFNHQFFK